MLLGLRPSIPVNYLNPYPCCPYPEISRAMSMADTLYLAGLNYQVDHYYDESKENYVGNLILPSQPEKVKKVAKFCSTILGKSSFAGIIAESASSIFVVYRGTKGVMEGVTDARAFVKTSFSNVPNGGQVHRGFYNLYMTTREKIFNTLQNLSTAKTLYVVGHSLGGAMATLCGLDLAVNSNFKQPVVCTFGSPRVGDQQFVSTFDDTIKTSVRVVNKRDWVPCVPLEDMGYVHVKGEYSICVDNSGADLFKNHLLNKAYFPGLAAVYPDYANNLCIQNPGFCPPKYDAQLCNIASTPSICSDVRDMLRLKAVKNSTFTCTC